MVKDFGEPRGGWWILGGVIIAAVPALGYSLAFAYEAGLCSEFAIPWELIKLELPHVFIASASVLVIFSGLFWITNMFLMLVQPKPYGPIWRSLISLSPVLVICLACILIYRGLWQNYAWVLAFAAFLVFMEFVFPILTYEARRHVPKMLVGQRDTETQTTISPPVKSRKTTYREMLEAQEVHEAQIKTVFNYMSPRLLKEVLFSLFIVFLLVFVAFNVGRMHAISETEYLVPSTHEDSVVMRIYGDNAICTKVARETGEVHENFFVINISNAPSTVFRLEKIGPLKLSKTQEK